MFIDKHIFQIKNNDKRPCKPNIRKNFCAGAELSCVLSDSCDFQVIFGASQRVFDPKITERYYSEFDFVRNLLENLTKLLLKADLKNIKTILCRTT